MKQNIIDMYNANPSSVGQILESVKELNVIPALLDSLPPFLALDLAYLSDNQKLMNLESWLQEKLKNQQQMDVFARQCLDYLNQKISVESQRQEGNLNLPIPISVEAMSAFFKTLSASSISSAMLDMVKEVQTRCSQTFPKLMNVGNQTAPGTEVSFKPDIEEEANLYYERIYNGELSLDAMIDLLKKLSVSKDSREQDVFACMIHNLFDEYTFFPKYPDKELSITSILFGSLIQHRLVSYVPLGIALRYILEALRNPMGSKMFNFGVQALRQFQSRLSEWPQYCAHLLQIPDLTQAHPDLAAFIQAAMHQEGQQQQQQQQIKPGENLMVDSRAGNYQAAIVPFTTVHIPPVPSDDDYMEPSSAIQDKILFIINNVAQNNVESKVTDLLEVLTPTAYKWFGNYLVVKRVSSEPNYHELYILVLDSVNSKLLNTHVLSETFANILILLNSEKTVSNSSERTLLKNLGSWLGRMTLAKNKPILHKYIAFKDLLLEGYDTQRLIVVIPFVCKVLEQCAHSHVFRPPNPWTMAILKLLVELYDYAELKLNLKFEIEVLCKSLSLELKSIPPTSVLKNRQPQAAAAATATTPYQMAMTMGRNSITGSGAGYPGQGAAGGNPLLQNADLESSILSESMVPVPNLAPYIAFNPQIALYTTQPAAKRLVLQAFTESIREIIGPVVERAVAIAVVSTRDLVTKDFVMETDENKMRKAAHMMAQNLAASLAMVTSKEPLRLSVVANLQAIFLAHGLNDTLAEQAIILTVADNLDLMCAVIEKSAMEKATMEIDEALSNAFMNRKKHREQRPTQAYVDLETYQMSTYMNTLPPALRPKPTGLLPAQFNVYEDFLRIPRVAPATTANGSMMDRSGRMESNFNYAGAAASSGLDNSNNNSLVMAATPGQQPQQQMPQVSAHMILERFAQYITELEKLTSQTNVNSVNALPQHSDIRTLIRQIPMLALASFDKTEAARTFAQKVVQLLYKSEKQLTIEVYVILLEHLCEVSPNVGTLVTSWLTHADDERKYNVPVTVALIKAGLINLPEQDQELAILIESGRKSAIEFTVRLIRACLFGGYPLVTRHEFIASLEALNSIRNHSESVVSLLEDLMKTPEAKERGLREQLQLYFAEWVRLYQHPASTEKTMLAFATQLSQQNMFKMDDISSLFYRVCIEVSVEHAIKFKMMPGQSPNLAYQPMDALSKLIVCLIQVSMTEGQMDAVAHFTRALSVTVLIISQHHEMRGQHFDQRPFLRLFTCILSDLHTVEQSIQPLYLPLLTAFSNTLYTLQPKHYTGFTFAWLQLISHRFFMPQLLLSENQKGWPAFQRLLVSLFEFLVPYLHTVELQVTTRMLYRGTLRVLLVLLHDFPEFLCDYHYSLCDVIPGTCIQMRNLILSAFPRNMRLPDPFTPNLKIDLLPEINQSPHILTDFTTILEETGLMKEIDQYFETGKPPTSRFLKDLPGRLVMDKGNSYRVPLVNALVFYVGTRTIAKGTSVHQGPAAEIYQYLLTELDSEGRYLMLSAIANQLRYPNSHTHYFSCVLLYLFVEGKKEIAKEQITRVLLERLIVNRPHPWGLLITFIELIKNPRYSFWSHSFTRCATDIERLFESVSR
ncbi:MAG: CCR4-Not complex component, Not1-domain-containing protein [Benjaminiella poitrasii]|nr:MAG: CCR4-Not complex component, Not1-domain-containing protein [Benjaminiella poitrasii]